MADFPSPDDLIPHSGSMLLLDKILDHNDERTLCRIDPSRNELFLDDRDRVPTWVGLEYLGQAACAHVILKQRDESDGLVGGILISARDLDLDFDGFRADRDYDVEATHLVAQGRLQSCEGRIYETDSGREVTRGRLNAFVSDDLEDLQQAGR